MQRAVALGAASEGACPHEHIPVRRKRTNRSTTITPAPWATFSPTHVADDKVNKSLLYRAATYGSIARKFSRVHAVSRWVRSENRYTA